MAENKEFRIILDTNLWISWLITKDFQKLDQLIENKNIKLIFSQELLEEFLEVAQRPKLKKYFRKNILSDLLEVIDEHAIFVKVNSKVKSFRVPGSTMKNLGNIQAQEFNKLNAIILHL